MKDIMELHGTKFRLRLPNPPEKQKHHDRLVRFTENPRDFNVPVLRMLGLTAKAIAEKVGMTEGMVSYRLGKVNRGRPYGQRITSLSWRDGTNPFLQAMLYRDLPKVAAKMTPVIRNAEAGQFVELPSGV